MEKHTSDAHIKSASQPSCRHGGTYPLIKLPLLYMVTGTSSVSIAVRADVI